MIFSQREPRHRQGGPAGQPRQNHPARLIRLSRPARIFRNLALAALLICLAWLSWDYPAFSRERALRQMETANLLPASELIADFSLEPGASRRLLVGASSESLYLCRLRSLGMFRWTEAGPLLVYPLKAPVTAVPVPEEIQTADGRGFGLLVFDQLPEAVSLKAEVSLDCSFVLNDRHVQFQETYAAEARRIQEGLFFLSFPSKERLSDPRINWRQGDNPADQAYFDELIQRSVFRYFARLADLYRASPFSQPPPVILRFYDAEENMLEQLSLTLGGESHEN